MSDPTKTFWLNRSTPSTVIHYQDPEDEDACGQALPIEGKVRCDTCGTVGEMPAETAKALAS